MTWQILLDKHWNYLIFKQDIIDCNTEYKENNKAAAIHMLFGEESYHTESQLYF